MAEFALGKVAMVQNGNWAYKDISDVDGNTVKKERTTMCLSDAYEIRDGKQNLVCSRVCNVSADGENVTLTDLMGIRKIVPGKLKKVDLMSNVILIEPC